MLAFIYPVNPDSDYIREHMDLYTSEPSNRRTGGNPFKAPIKFDSIVPTNAVGYQTLENPFSADNIKKNWKLKFTLHFLGTNTASGGTYFGFTKRTNTDANYYIMNFKLIYTSTAKSLAIACNPLTMNPASTSYTTIASNELVDTILDKEITINKSGTKITIECEGQELWSTEIVNEDGNDDQMLCFGCIGTISSVTFEAKDTFELQKVSFEYD